MRNALSGTPRLLPAVAGYCFLVLLVVAQPLYAQKPARELIRNKHEQGEMFFIKPRTYTGDIRQKEGIDFTLDHRDTSVSVFSAVFFFKSKEPIRTIDSSWLMHGDRRIAHSVLSERYFVEPKGKKWVNRHAVRFGESEALEWLLSSGDAALRIFWEDQSATIRFSDSEWALIHTIGQVMAIETDYSP